MHTRPRTTASSTRSSTGRVRRKEGKNRDWREQVLQTDARPGATRSMGLIEDRRQFIPDFLTPENRLINARLTVVEKRIETKLDRVRTTLGIKMNENRAQRMDALHRTESPNQVLERLARVNSKLQSIA